MSQNDQLDNLDIAVSNSLLGHSGAKPSITVSNLPVICNTQPEAGCHLTAKPKCP